jgi:acyl-CoA synthetase (AMP-forming)/AMP-acid ligase II
MPKGPRVTHGQFVARFTVYWLDLGLNGQDRFVTATPIYFGGGRGFALAMIYAGGTSCLFPPPFKPEELLAFMHRVSATATFLVPTQLRRLLEDERDTIAFPMLRVLISSGSALYAAEQRAVRAKLTPNLYQYYSSTEGGGCSVLAPDNFEGHPDSVGQPLFGVDVEVVDDNHQPVPAGVTGRLRYRSAASATEYFKGDGSAAFHEGWFYPGDLGALDEDGFVYLRGRSKDMIIRGGVNIYPGDIEQVLLEFDDVAEAAVVGQPSKEFGEDIVAFVVARVPIAEDVLRKRCAERLARYKMPKTFVFVDALPKTSMGKIAKAELVKMLA